MLYNIKIFNGSVVVFEIVAKPLVPEVAAALEESASALAQDYDHTHWEIEPVEAAAAS